MAVTHGPMPLTTTPIRPALRRCLLALVVKLANYRHTSCDRKAFEIKDFFYGHLCGMVALKECGIFLLDAGCKK